MNSVLAKTVSEHQRDWDLHLNFALAAFRATRHDSTGYTLNYLVFGREVRTPVDIVYREAEGEPPDDYDAFVEDFRERSTTAYAEVRSSLGKAAERNKRYYNIGVRKQRFKVGDWVLYFNCLLYTSPSPRD